MNARTVISVDEAKLTAALARFPRERAMWIDGRAAHGAGETIERLSPAHGVLVTRVPRGGASDARLAIAAARRAFELGALAEGNGFEPRAGVVEDRRSDRPRP